MLTADLVCTRRRGDLLSVVALDSAARARAIDLATIYVDLAAAHVGLSRGAFSGAAKLVPVAAHDRRLADGLQKLVYDRCSFEEATGPKPESLRRDLFTQAAAQRRTLGGRQAFDRHAVMYSVAATHALTPEQIERGLFADLPDAHQLIAFDHIAPSALVSHYEQASVQAVLLRAVRITATVLAASPGAYRTLFRKLKFLRLLPRIEPLPEGGGYTIEIDGPFSLFESVTKYGLQLALALPALTACDTWSLSAELRWGKERTPLRFAARGHAHDAATTPDGIPSCPDNVAALLEDFAASGGPWRARISSTLLPLPGVGICVPDIELQHEQDGRIVYVEVLGFWGRDAVWKRIELVERGLAVPILFAVNKHLRVSEAILDDKATAALYVFPRAPNARVMLEKVAILADRPRQL